MRAEKRSSLNSIGESDSRTWHRAALRGIEYPGWLSSWVFFLSVAHLWLRQENVELNCVQERKEEGRVQPSPGMALDVGFKS